ncbi:MAG: META domain-containing protein [Anaerolineales bacterium]|nr:META domain-containing protein [Anaerolineales bacterium]
MWPTIQFISETAMGGFDGCNHFDGEYSYSTLDGSLEYGVFSIRALACGYQIVQDGETGDFIEQDYPFLDYLSKTNRYALDSNELVLFNSDDPSFKMIFHPFEDTPSDSSLSPSSSFTIPD